MKSQAELRQAMRQLLESQSQEDRVRRSQQISEKVLRSSSYQKAEKIHFFMSMPTEVNTAFLIDGAIQAGKRTLLPRADFKSKELIWYEIKSRAHDLRMAPNGILEPDGNHAKEFKENAECVFVPGVVFDKLNNRIGRGAGFYDRFLSRVGSGVAKVGLAFSFQVLDRIPVNAHDIPMDEVITDGD